MSSLVDHQQRFTYGDYVLWPEDERWELIDGMAYNMTPAPSTVHQEILGELFLQVATALKGKPCRVFIAPFDVRLPDGDEADEQVNTVVQPDLSVVCDPAKIDKAGCRGAPDFVIEVMSPSTARKDQTIKAALYERHGVREYWIIHPEDRLLTMRILGADGRIGVMPVVELRGRQAVAVLAGVEVDLEIVGELCREAFPMRATKASPAGAAGPAVSGDSEQGSE